MPARESEEQPELCVARHPLRYSAAVPHLDPLTQPFWRSLTMHRESVVFTAFERGPATATLLFAPDEVEAVTSLAGDVAFHEGADFLIDRTARRLVRVAGSKLPQVDAAALTSADGALTFAQTISVTYTHAVSSDEWDLPAARFELPRMIERLTRRDAVTICVTGDSISEGYDASGFHGVAPHQPGYAPLVVNALEERYGAPVRLINLAVAGSTSADGVWTADAIAAARPDLVIVAFGMNDACYAEAGEFADNISAIVARVKDRAPDAEFVLVSPMLPTAACHWVAAPRFGDYRAALAGLSGPGVALADVTTVWERLLTRKRALDLSGNGLNHPNDFGHRIYAQTILNGLGAYLP